MIGLLFTGGTISMKPDPGSGAVVPAMGARELLEQVPSLGTIADIEAEDFSRVPGWQVTPDHMWRLARRAAAWLERPDVDGLVITHGTDTIEETACLLDLVLTSAKPAVIVGAMRTMADPGWDGPANLAAGVRVAASASSRDRGTLVVLNDRVHAGIEAIKGHTSALDTFRSPEPGPVGVLDGSVVHFRRPPLPRPAWQDPHADAGLRVTRIDSAVDLVTAAAGADDRLVLAALAGPVHGLVIQALGRGNVPPAMRPGIALAIERNLPVVIASRCGAGAVAPHYGSEGGGRDLMDLGAIPAGALPASKARMVLMVALGLAGDAARLGEIFGAYA